MMDLSRDKQHLLLKLGDSLLNGASLGIWDEKLALARQKYVEVDAWRAMAEQNHFLGHPETIHY